VREQKFHGNTEDAMSAQLSTDLRMQQLQILAPQLQQSLKLLQMPTLELQALMKQQLVTNPTLEQIDPAYEYADEDLHDFDPDRQDLHDSLENAGRSVAEDAAALSSGNGGSQERSEQKLDAVTSEDHEWRDYYDNVNNYGDYRERPEVVAYHERRYGDDEAYNYRIASIPADESLVDDLRQHYMSLDLTPEEVEIMEYLIGSLDGNGFLVETPQELAEMMHADVATVAHVVHLFKQFEPAGIGARDLRECLLTQLERLGRKDSRAYTLLKDYFDELLHNRMEKIASGMSISLPQVQEILGEIGQLDPKPGRDLGTATAATIRPDIIVRKREDGEYEVETNDNMLPYVRISPRVRNLLKHKALDKPTTQYLRQQVRDGESLMNNLQFRKRTILAVAEVIVEAQKDFFEEGETALRPLNMKDVAGKVGVHEATVSRTVHQKYMDTPQGMYEMRYFFSAHVTNNEGREISTNAVKAKLKELIEAEDKRKPLSDDKLATKLSEEGFPVARRTVVKYRQAMDILNTRQRKSYFQV
jgi:RNA polymerase sigma-54 factor